MGNKVYVELDALLDTRLATVSSIQQQAAVTLVKSEDYYERRSDDFSTLTGIEHEVYLKAYAERSVDTLTRSIKTHIPLMLNELINKLEIQEESTPDISALELEVNVWPYTDLSAEEQDALLLAVMAHAGIQTTPSIVCFDPKELTPRRLKASYSGLILYNLRDWLQHHMEAFTKCRCPDIAVLAPALYNDKIVETKDLMEDPNLRTDISVFSLTEIACAEFFALNYLNVNYFSIWR